MKHVLIIMFVVSFNALAQSPLERLENSPRHHEWADINYSDRQFRAFIVYPEVSGKVPAVIVIHENRGLNDWARSMADQIAEAGYIAIAPDLLWGSGPGGQGTASFPNSDEARTAIYALSPEQVTDDLNATFSYAENIPSANGKVVVIGFCWGGSQSFRFATNNSNLSAVFVCYGSGPDQAEEYKNIEAPVYGFYGGNDNRVNATIDKSKEFMEEYGKKYDPVIYEGAGHGFFRAGESQGASFANRKARNEAMERLKRLLSEL